MNTIDIDLCDRCPSLAYGRIVLPSGRRLAFCRTHMGLHGQALAAPGARLESVAKQVPEFVRIVHGRITP